MLNNYFCGTQANQYAFVKIPKLLMIDEHFSHLSTDAKILYGLLLDRMGLSLKNKWIDHKNRVYVIYPILEIQKDLNITKRQAKDNLSELEKIGLVEEKSRGKGT